MSSAYIMSPVEDIRNLVIRRLPTGTPVNVAKAVRVNSLCIMMTSDGTLYHDGALGNYSYGIGNYTWTAPMMKALKRLGVITQAQLVEHMDLVRKRDSDRQAKWDMEQLEKLSKRHGFRLSVQQQKMIKEAQ